MEFKKAKFTETESKRVVTRGYGVGKWGYVGQRVQASSYKMNKFWGSNVRDGLSLIIVYCYIIIFVTYN